jgi:hypothetical protein
MEQDRLALLESRVAELEAHVVKQGRDTSQLLEVPWLCAVSKAKPVCIGGHACGCILQKYARQQHMLRNALNDSAKQYLDLRDLVRLSCSSSYPSRCEHPLVVVNVVHSSSSS